MKVVIFCGGKGTRLREETEYRPKPMVPIGERPIVWHIMKLYAQHGHTDFILCLGYKGEIIKDYFRNYHWMTNDVTLGLGPDPRTEMHGRHNEENWRVTLADTGQESMTAERLNRVARYLGDDEHFLLTYGDGVGNIDIPASIAAHRASGKLLTVTAVHPPGRFGDLQLDGANTVTGFNEKPQSEGGWINGGFFVASRGVLQEIAGAGNVMLERGPLDRMASSGRLGAYRHEGFWQPMDTYQEFLYLNRLWAEGKAPWKTWTA
jgi:glucose-1-phosphate cytidylyltransferase